MSGCGFSVYFTILYRFLFTSLQFHGFMSSMIASLWDPDFLSVITENMYLMVFNQIDLTFFLAWGGGGEPQQEIRGIKLSKADVLKMRSAIFICLIGFF